MRAGRRIAAAAFFAGALFLGGLAAYLAWDWRTPAAPPESPVMLTVPRGMKAGQVAEAVVREGLVRSRFSFKAAFALYGNPRKIRAGTYRFDGPMTPLQIIDKFNRGDVVYLKVTIPEGLRKEEVAKVLADAGLGSRDALLAAAADPSPIRDLDPGAPDLEGYLFPETYLLDPGLSEKAVISALVRGFRGWWERRGAASSQPREVVTLASLVEKETASAPERPLVAGVFANRLRLGMPLQTDPSIVYAQERAGVYRGFLTREDWAYPSPFNTYLHAGLPPGPICSPGLASLEAALHPQDTPFLYFVAKGDGTHAFGRTLQEHNANVARYRRAGGGGGGRSRR